MPQPIRRRILVTGASAGLGAGMARRFAARGRDPALVARRLDLLVALRDELLAASPGIRVVTAALDVDDADAVAEVVPRLAGELGGLNRVVANAGIGKGGSVGTGVARANRATLSTNVLGTHAQCEAAVEPFRAQGHGHLVLISSVALVAAIEREPVRASVPEPTNGPEGARQAPSIRGVCRGRRLSIKPRGRTTGSRRAFIVAIAVTFMALIAPQVIAIVDPDGPLLVRLLLLGMAVVTLAAALIIGRTVMRP